MTYRDAQLSNRWAGTFLHNVRLAGTTVEGSPSCHLRRRRRGNSRHREVTRPEGSMWPPNRTDDVDLDQFTGHRRILERLSNTWLAQGSYLRYLLLPLVVVTEGTLDRCPGRSGVLVEELCAGSEVWGWSWVQRCSWC